MPESDGPRLDLTSQRPRPRGSRALTRVLGLTMLVGLAIVALLAPGPAVPNVAGRAQSRNAGPLGAGATPSSPPSPSSPPRPSGPFTVVALGDSVPAATTCACVSYVEQVGARLHSATGRPWVVRNDAIGGWTTTDVAASLQTPPTREDAVAADLVILQVGANDFDLTRVDDPDCHTAASPCFATAIQALRTNLTDVIDGVHAINHRPDLRIAVLGYWNVTVDGAVGQALGEDFVVGSDQLTKSVNASIEQVAADTGSVYVDAYTPLKGDASAPRDPTSDLLDDGDHLNATGHAILATAVVHTLEQSGALASWGP